MYIPKQDDFAIKRSSAKKKSNAANLSLHLDLTLYEKDILLKACKIYRSKIPSYLQSKKSELEAIDKVIKKLT